MRSRQDEQAGEAEPQGRWATRRRSLAARVGLALVVAAALSTQSLITSAERLAFGPRRTVALSAATAVHDGAASVGLDRPAELLRSVTGRQQDGPVATNGVGREQPDVVTAALDRAPAAPAADSNRSRSASTAQPATSTPSTAAPTTTIATTTTTQPEPSARPVGPGDELRVWTGGDSLGEYVGNHLLAELADPALVSLELDYRISTGLARPDYFDWPAQLAAVGATDPPPDAMIFMVGGNDDQNMQRDDGIVELGTDAWYDEYERRVSSIVDAVDPTTTRVYWIGLPPMREADRHEVSMGMNAVVRRVATTRPHVTFVDLEQRLADPDGLYRSHIAAPDGELRLARQADGVHITFVASTWVADIVWELLEEDWALDARTDPAAPDARSPGDLDPSSLPR